MVWEGVHGKNCGPTPVCGVLVPPSGVEVGPPPPPGPLQARPAGAPPENHESKLESSVVDREVPVEAGGIGDVALCTRVCIICQTLRDGSEWAAACVSA